MIRVGSLIILKKEAEDHPISSFLVQGGVYRVLKLGNNGAEDYAVVEPYATLTVRAAWKMKGEEGKTNSAIFLEMVEEFLESELLILKKNMGYSND